MSIVVQLPAGDATVAAKVAKNPQGRSQRTRKVAGKKVVVPLVQSPRELVPSVGHDQMSLDVSI